MHTPIPSVTPLVLILLAGCSSSQPIIEAHRAGAGYAPENSPTAVELAIASGWTGIEVDVALLAEGAVLNHGETLDPARCDGPGGQPVEAMALADLMPVDVALIVCGGRLSPDFPSALVRAEPLVHLVDFYDALHAADDRTLVHLDLKISPEADLPAAAQTVLGPWFTEDLPQPLVVSSPHVEVLSAFRSWAAQRGLEVRTSLSWPYFPDGGAVGRGLAVELGRELGLASPVRVAERAGVDGLALQWEVARRDDVFALRRAGFDVQLWTLDGASALRAHARWPVTSLITNYPGDRP